MVLTYLLNLFTYLITYTDGVAVKFYVRGPKREFFTITQAQNHIIQGILTKPQNLIGFVKNLQATLVVAGRGRAFGPLPPPRPATPLWLLFVKPWFHVKIKLF